MYGVKGFAENKEKTLSREERKQELIKEMKQQIQDYGQSQSRNQGISMWD